LESREKITPEDVKSIKEKKELPILVGEIELKELSELFPEYFSERKLKYYKTLLKRMEKKVAFEVNLQNYIENLKKLGFDYAIEKLKLPSPEEIEYYGIAVIMAMSLTKKGKILLTYSPYVTPLLLELKTRYTTYDFLQILELSSKYSVILFRIIKEKLGLRQTTFVLTFGELQKLMDTSFKRWVDFNRKVLKPAVEEINTKTKYTVEYKTLKEGKKVDRIAFTVKEKPLPSLFGKNFDKEIIRELISSFQREGENITPEEFAYILLSLQRVNPAVAIWFLLHYPEGEPRLYAWEHIRWVEENTKINHPDKYLESLIKDKNKNLDWLLDQRTKDLIRIELEKLALPVLEKERKRKKVEKLFTEIVKTYKYLPREGKLQLLKSFGMDKETFKAYLLSLKENLKEEELRKVLEIVKNISEKYSIDFDDLF
jgi:hypothetical protein